VKVLYVTSWLGIGGIEVNIVRLADELRRRGDEAVVASGPGVLLPQLEAAGGRHAEVIMAPGRPLASLQSILRLRDIVAHERPDIIHVFSASSAAVLWAALRLPGRPRRSRPPVVSTVMGLRMADDEGQLKSLLRAWGVALGADRLIITAPAIDDVIRRVRISPKRLIHAQVVGVPEPAGVPRAPLRRELSIPDGAKLVVSIGRLAPDKSHHLYLRAAAQILRSRDDLRFVLVGGGPLADELVRLRDDLGLQGRFHLLGERIDIEAILRATDVYVRPGLVEGFVGITMLEAQMLGVPVIGFDTKDTHIAMEHGVSGVIVPPWNVDGLARAICDLADDGERAARIGAQGARSVRRLFSMGAVTDGLIDIYERLLHPSV
jgi:glycosyltransferase involved in cell wall biosynthesis